MLLQVFVTSGLGGMSGAQAKASVIAGCVGVVAEVHIKNVIVLILFEVAPRHQHLVENMRPA